MTSHHSNYYTSYPADGIYHSWMEPPPEPIQLLCYGYVRQHRIILKIVNDIPDDIKHLVYEFFPKKCM